MDPLPPAMPSFADVLEIVKTIPDARHAERVTFWAKEKYNGEMHLEEKVERLEKDKVNSNFKIQNLEKAVKSLRVHNDERASAQIAELERRLKEQKKQIKELQHKQVSMNMEIVRNEDLMMGMNSRCLEKEKVIEEKNKKIYELMDKVTELEKKTVFYEEEITKLLDEKEEMLNEMVEASDDESDSDSDSDSDSSSDSSSSDSESDDEEEENEDNLQGALGKRYRIVLDHSKELELLKNQLKVAEMLLTQANKDLHASEKQRSSVYKTLNSKLATAKRNAEETEEKAEIRCRVLSNKIKKLETEFAEDLEIEKNEKSQALLKLSEQTKKAKEEREKHMAEVSLLEKRIVDLQTSHQIKMEELKASHMNVVRSMTDEIRELDSRIHYVIKSSSEKTAKLQKEFQAQYDSQKDLINKLYKSEKEQYEQRIVSQNKLVDQMEKNMRLQDEVLELTRRTFRALDDDVDSIGSRERDCVGLEDRIEVGEEPEVDAVDIDYSSDSSFEPVDEQDL